MSKLIYSTPLRYNEGGPWFIGKEKLAELEEIYVRNIEKINLHVGEKRQGQGKSIVEDARKMGEAQSTIDALDRYLAGVISYEIKFEFQGNKKLVCSSLTEALRHPEFIKEGIVNFSIETEGYPYTCNLSIGDLHLHLWANPEEDDYVRAFYSEVHSWVLSVEPPAWQRIWRSVPRLAFPTAWLLVVSLLGQILSINPRKAELQSQAKKILESEAYVHDQRGAIETLLKLNVDYTLVIPVWAYVAAALSLVVVVVLCFPPPHFLIGLGIGTRRIDSWRRRIKISFIIIPGAIFASFILPTLQKLWEKLF